MSEAAERRLLFTHDEITIELSRILTHNQVVRH